MVIRNLERSAGAKVKLSFKALAYHREHAPPVIEIGPARPAH